MEVKIRKDKGRKKEKKKVARRKRMTRRGGKKKVKETRYRKKRKWRKTRGRSSGLKPFRRQKGSMGMCTGRETQKAEGDDHGRK